MRAPTFAIVLGVLAAAAAVAACSGAADPPATSTPITTPAESSTRTTKATLPAPSQAFAPSEAETDGHVDGKTLTETESCAGCHADAAAQWRSSAHAFGSFNNPIYRVVIDRFRGEADKDKSRFCGGCHDVALLVDGAMSGEVGPDDSRAHGGITCRVCHGIETTRPDGNGSWVLDTSPIPIPRDGDDESLRAHKARMALAPLRTAQLCGSCHRSFLSPATANTAHLTGQDELGAWERSVYAGSAAARIDEPVDEAECRTCHMPLERAALGDAAAKDGMIRSHRFAGGNTWLPAMRDDAVQLEAVQAMLRGAASIDVATARDASGTRTMPADGAPVAAGESVTLDVVVRNEHAGHRFPGGVLDAQDTWVEIVVHDAGGRLLAEAGGTQEATGEDRSAHELRVVQADEHGTPLLLRETNRFRAPVFDHTIAPRDAELARFRFDVPARLDARQLPLRVTARLRHRARNLALARAVCAESRTPRGTAFTREVHARTDAWIDGCASEPVTDLATSEVWIGTGSPAASSTMPAWRRLYDEGLALLHAQQEEVDTARPILERALALSDGSDRIRAMILQTMAEMAIREGRTDEALGLLDQVESLAPGEPSVDHARAEALGGIWRWKEAAVPLREAALAAPLDDKLWSHLAVAYGSADQSADALEAARHALALAPRDADALRVQALALDRLGASTDVVTAARDAYALWRPPDDAPAVKSACSRQLPWCALERLPVHAHAMHAIPRRL
ncbi:MAG TPA: multiheme c-type cytochrome [Polyangiaceae bacterium]